MACIAALALYSTAASSAEVLAQKDSPRCQVWQRELGFAKSIADHDPVALAGFLAANTAFGVSREPTVGREAVTREWQGIIDGSALRLEWYPDAVTIGGDGNTAYSSGPSLRQDPNTGQYRHSRFGSVWQRGADGVWRVIFDDGTRSEPADEAAVQAFRAGSGRGCPPG
jgi:ketosteroid isomerase-like protein